MGTAFGQEKEKGSLRFVFRAIRGMRLAAMEPIPIVLRIQRGVSAIRRRLRVQCPLRYFLVRQRETTSLRERKGEDDIAVDLHSAKQGTLQQSLRWVGWVIDQGSGSAFT